MSPGGTQVPRLTLLSGCKDQLFCSQPLPWEAEAGQDALEGKQSRPGPRAVGLSALAPAPVLARNPRLSRVVASPQNPGWSSLVNDVLMT